ncbi:MULTISPECIES: Lrp/AsnC ligand binding domain-containing protein [Halobacteriovorax]|uniref:AsnC family transcriptional regulator n=1 Tax=Halobacteriovorax vibrionivorans TaxID=2152716 RepID=A0ABY0III1_9BACT|nr:MULTISPECIES: Lrp/AsnC ligand binding domain-containing protein [Halobacteriovorax]RZF22422.1 AsnC family transcriptional regulator [Halobacteriovorax vibrionivorans]TGD47613.1 AsnC family transcriptional regulator [Halobacteriovorax sp. Y22]
MAEKYEIDSTDKKIIKLLEKDARMPFLEMARKIGVSGGTIHQRVEKLKEAGIIIGSSIKVDYAKLGHGVVVLLGLHLVNARDIHKVIDKLEKMDEIVEAYYTTGDYALIVKIMVKDINHFHEFLIGKIQMIKEIQSTESFISLKQVIDKSLNV